MPLSDPFRSFMETPPCSLVFILPDAEHVQCEENKYNNPHIKETQSKSDKATHSTWPLRIKSIISTPRHIIIRLSNIKVRKYLKSNNREVTHQVQWFSIRLTVNFSPETTKVKRPRDDLFKVLRGRLSTKNSKYRKPLLRSE